MSIVRNALIVVRNEDLLLPHQRFHNHAVDSPFQSSLRGGDVCRFGNLLFCHSDAQCPFEETLYQVAPGAEHHHGQSHADPLHHTQL